MDDGRPGQALNQYSTSLFVVDSRPSYVVPDDDYFYDRCGDAALGTDAVDTVSPNARRCFNCGSPDHIISSCPEPRNHALVTLSRQLFNFYKDDSVGGFQRIHEVEEWKQQSLDWLEHFEPGQIKGLVLREALGLRDGDIGECVEWLRNMACWGYPKGWVGDVDPRERVWRMISGEDEQETGEDDEPSQFVIVGDKDEEALTLPSNVGIRLAEETTSEDGYLRSETASSSSTASSSFVQTTTRRWATYPGTYFLSSRLPIYDGRSLPAMDSGSSAGYVTSTHDSGHQALWSSIVSSPWLLSYPSSNSAPPVPSMTLPPLPPPPSTPPPPLPPNPVSAQCSHTNPSIVSPPESILQEQIDVDQEESDMDMSD